MIMSLMRPLGECGRGTIARERWFWGPHCYAMGGAQLRAERLLK